MKFTIAYAAAVAVAIVGPVHAYTPELRQATLEFCRSIRRANELGMSARPGSQLGASVAEAVDGTESMGYRKAWDLAKRMGIPECNIMW